MLISEYHKMSRLTHRAELGIRSWLVGQGNAQRFPKSTTSLGAVHLPLTIGSVPVTRCDPR